MKLKRFVALLTALMLSLTIAYADTTATRIYDAVVDLLTNTTNVTLTGKAIFSLDGKQFKTVETTYEQDGVNSRWVLNMTSPRANGSLKNSGFTIIANNRFKYAMEVFNPGTYKFVECDPQSAILRSSVVLTQLVSLGHTVVNQIPEWSGNEVSRTKDGKLSIHLTDEQIPVSVNDLLGLGVLLAVQRTLSIVDDSVVTPAYPAEANTFEASVACTTPTRAIINHTEKYELTALSAEIGMDESGRLTEASGTAHFVLHTFQDGDHELDISFSGKVFDYGNSHVPAFDATEYKVVPEAGTVIPLDIYNENSENYDLSENASIESALSTYQQTDDVDSAEKAISHTKEVYAMREINLGPSAEQLEWNASYQEAGGWYVVTANNPGKSVPIIQFNTKLNGEIGAVHDWWFLKYLEHDMKPEISNYVVSKEVQQSLAQEIIQFIQAVSPSDAQMIERWDLSMMSDINVDGNIHHIASFSFYSAEDGWVGGVRIDLDDQNRIVTMELSSTGLG